MKKIKELLKPFIFIIFGALLFLFYFNELGKGGVKLATGILFIVLAAFTLTVGIFNVILGDKLGKAKGIMNMVCVACYPLFLGVNFLLDLIDKAGETDAWADKLGPNGWTVAIISILVSLALGVILIVAYFVRNKRFHRVTFLFAAIFILVLLIDLLIDENGDPEYLGAIQVLQVVVYGCYVSMLIQVLSSFRENKESKKEEEPKEEQPAEEEGKEEAQAE